MTTQSRRNPLQSELEYKLSRRIITELDNGENLTLGELLNLIGLVTGIALLTLATIIPVESISYACALLFPLPMALCQVRVRHSGGRDMLGVMTRGFGLFVYAFYGALGLLWLIAR